jgi:aryl-alcohol dehydrogenase-like predicted oxidoreductase
MPWLDKIVRRNLGQRTVRASFSSESARKSLEFSLRELRTDYVDIWLLHEAAPMDANDPALLAFLADQHKKGVILGYGIGGDFRCFAGGGNSFADAHAIFQFENSVAKPNRARLARAERRSLITYGAMKPFSSVRERLQRRPDLITRFGQETGLDLARADDLGALLLAWAIHDNSDGAVLFNSSHAENIRANVATLEDVRFDVTATRRFGALLAEVPADDVDVIS